jgi:anti-anti-sigma regulatory factor
MTIELPRREHTMIDINVDQEKDATNMTISGSLTVEHASEVKTAFQGALNRNAKNITLTLGNVTKVDVTFFQLLCSTHRKVMEGGRSFVVEKFHQDQMTRTLRTLGFNRSKGCACDARRSCVFMRMSA